MYGWMYGWMDGWTSLKQLFVSGNAQHQCV